ncbi:MAG: hypothetical protein ABIO06_05675 [Pseudolysinimonas sp.]
MSDNPYEGLRQLALSVVPADLGFTPTTDLPDVFGVVADLALQGTATLVCFRDGTTSIYYSTGGGAIGMGQHESIARAASVLIATVQAELGEFSASNDATSLPAGHCRFTALTYRGPCTLTAAEPHHQRSDAAAGNVYRAFNAVIGAYRMWDESQKKENRLD